MLFCKIKSMNLVEDPVSKRAREKTSTQNRFCRKTLTNKGKSWDLMVVKRLMLVREAGCTISSGSRPHFSNKARPESLSKEEVGISLIGQVWAKCPVSPQYRQWFWE